MTPRIKAFFFLSFGICCFHQAMAKSKADKKTIKQLKADIGYLASDELEGRNTGSEGERKAGDYIIAHYKKAGIPAYKGDYRHLFHFVNGKEVTSLTKIIFWGDPMGYKDAFPMAFSANKDATSDAIPEVYEPGSIWLMPMFKDQAEADDAHFDWEKSAWERAKDAEKKGAIGIVFYDSYDSKFPPAFNAKSEYETVEIPVAYVTQKMYNIYSQNSGTNASTIPIELKINLKKVDRVGTNVAAFIDNKAPFTVVIGAHYDHLGHGEDGSSLNAKKDNQIHNGADDNASGTAALMQIATWVKTHQLNHYNYLFIHFSAEELGLIGSKNIVKDEHLDSTSVAYMLNMDMVGRLNDSTHALTLGGVGTSPAWASLSTLAKDEFKIVPDSSGVGPSDHTSFYNAHVPVLFVFTGTHHDYHKPSDDADKINYKGEAVVMNYVYSIIEKMDGQPRPKFTPTKQTDMGKTRFKVTLGIMPDYTFQDGGVRVDGVTEGKPAVKAGLKAGDIITQLGEHKVQGMQTYMEALSKFQPGDQTDVHFKRDGKEMKLPIEFNKK